MSRGAFRCLRLLLSPFLVLFTLSVASAQDDDELIVHRDSTQPFILQNVRINRWNVFDTTGADMPWLGNFFNSLHAVTKEQVIRHEIFVEPGDTVTQRTLDEIERNLRSLAVFSGIAVSVTLLDSIDYAEYPEGVLHITTRDSWSTQIAAGLSTGGNSVAYGATLQEVNLFGYAYQAAVGADYTDINDRGWRYTAAFIDPNVMGSHIRVGLATSFSALDKYAELSVTRPFFSDGENMAYGINAAWLDGTQFLYSHTQPVHAVSVPLTSTEGRGWYSISRGGSGDVFRWTFGLSYNRTQRDSLPGVRPAFENSIGTFLGLGSVRRKFVRMKNIEYHGESLVPIGAMGGAVLGKSSPHNGGLDNTVYIGAEARKAVQTNGLYGYVGIEAGTGLAGKEARYTLERLTASGAMKLGPGALLARFQQATVWNWPRYIIQSLDNLSGLRAYDVYDLIGDNKIMFNAEYVALPEIKLLFFKFGAAAFYDLGAVWNQSEKLSRTRFHSSAGVGLRISNLRASLGNGVLRIDFAYNFDQRAFTQVILSTQKSFDVFGTLDTRVPVPYTP